MSKAKKIQFPFAVRWQWYSDKGWANFPNPAIVKTLEAEFLKDTKKVKVDDERFVDFDFKTEKEIQANFNNFEKEKNLVGVQRRYDDPSKRRAVRREVPEFFDGEVACVSSEVLRPQFELYGGQVELTLTGKVTIYICFESDVKNCKDELKKAISKGIPVVNEHWLIDSISKGKAQPTKKAAYKVSLDESDSEEEAPTKSTKRKKAEDDDEDSGKGKKKKKSGDDDNDDEANLASLLEEPNSVWDGMCTYPESEEKFPFIFEVKKTLKKASGQLTLEGTVEWTTLKSKTKFRGTFNEGVLKFQEYEVVEGDDVEPGEYKGKVKGATFAGKVYVKDLDNGEVNFTLKPKPAKKSSSSSSSSSSVSKSTSSASSKALDCLKSGTRLQGLCFEEVPFVLTVTSRSGSKLSGVVKYTKDNEEVKFKGTLQDKQLTIEAGDRKLVTEDVTAINPDSSSKKLKERYILKGKVAGSKNTFEIKV